MPPRDVLATILVGIAAVIYLAWLFDMPFPALDTPSAIAIAVLVLGVCASLSAVVPSFSELLSGSRPYLIATSIFGLAAFGAGLWTIYASDTAALALMVVCTLVLWAASTVRHVGDIEYPTAA
jgi:hypothetical protein